MKIVFMGTPDIAVPCLQKIIDEKYEILGVVTQPDKPKGRGKKLGMSPVKELAIENNIPVYQPVKARDKEFIDKIKSLNPDVIYVVYMPYSGDDPEQVKQDALDKLLKDKAFSSLDAVKNKRVVPIMLGDMYASGVRTINGIETISAGLYPDLNK